MSTRGNPGGKAGNGGGRERSGMGGNGGNGGNGGGAGGSAAYRDFPAPVRAALLRAEGEVAALPREVAIAVDARTGAVLGRRQGTAGGVTIPSGARYNSAAIVVHNHPERVRDGVAVTDPAFSSPDIEHLIDHHLAGMVAVTAAGDRYVMRPPPEGWPRADHERAQMVQAVRALYPMMLDAARRDLRHEVAMGRATTAEAQRRLNAETWGKVARSLGLRYHAERR